MQINCRWNQKMAFTSEMDSHHVLMDANSPIGDGSGPTPKHLLLTAICGCTGMDVAALMKKHRQTVKSFEMEASAELTKTHPKVFETIFLNFKLTGEIEPDQLLSAIHLSMTQYCGVSAMVSKVSPIDYSVELNGVGIGEGHAEFEI